MVRLKRLKVHHYNLVKPGLELHFHDGMNLILGKNGTGKTTLLKLIDMCLRQNFGDLEKQEFHLEYELESEEYTLTANMENIKTAKASSADSQDLPHYSSAEISNEFQPSFKVSLHWKIPDFWFPDVDIDSSQFPWQVKTIDSDSSMKFEPSTPFKISSDDYLRRQKILIELEKHDRISTFGLWTRYSGMVPGAAISQAISHIAEHKRSRLVPQLNRSPNVLVPLRLDEAMEWFSTDSQISEIYTTIGYIGSHRVFTGSANPWNDLFFSTLFRDQFEEGARRLLISSRVAPGLALLASALEMKECELELDLKDTSETNNIGSSDPQINYTYGAPRFYFTRKDGVRFPFESLSFGQKRLFAFILNAHLWKEGPIVADELANGLHHSMIEYCFELIGKRQAFLATQNPLLIDHVGFSSAQEVRESFVRCTTARWKKRDVMVWEQLTDKEAEDFFADYQVGIQHVNQILRAKDLW